jgi:uncharacterized cofD-like protein
VRNCLAALASDEEGVLASVFQYRFAGGEGLAGHALGNLILAALTDLTGDFGQAVKVAEHALRTRGRVLPSTFESVTLHGVDRTGAEIAGQARLASNPTAVARVYLAPDKPASNPEAIEAIRSADAIIIGPGSLYTSLVPNFLVEGITEAVRVSTAQRVYVCNVANFRGETAGLDAADHVEALFEHGLSGAIDTVIVHDASGTDAAVCEDEPRVEPVKAGDEVRERIRALGPSVVQARVTDACDPVHHDAVLLQAALGEVLS